MSATSFRIARASLVLVLGLALPRPLPAEEQVWEPKETMSPAGGPQAFTEVLQTRKRQLVTSYYLYRGPVPTDEEMARAIGAIDRLILQDYSLEDVWSTLFHILISEPQLAMKPFEEVVPPNIRRASVWREGTTPVKVVVEERYPEYSFVYKRALQQKLALTWGGAAVFVPSYVLSVAFGSAATGTIYNQARGEDLEFSAGNAFLPLIPLVGPIATQTVLDARTAGSDSLTYDAGSHLVGAVWSTLLQSLGLTAMVIGVSQRLPAPFEDGSSSSMPRTGPPPGPSAQLTVGPGSVVVEGTF